MTPDELLIRRYKCIAPIPFQPFPDMCNVGDIFTDNGKTTILNQNGDAVCVAEWDKYPHLFQPLPWYADRLQSDMPEYIKSNDVIYKVSKWIGSYQNLCWVGCYVNDNKKFIPSENLQPVIHEEYEQWKQSNK